MSYDLVGALEANLHEGRLSVEAPVGRALFGLRAGDVAVVATPAGTQRFELLSVEREDGARREEAA